MIEDVGGGGEELEAHALVVSPAAGKAAQQIAGAAAARADHDDLRPAAARRLLPRPEAERIRQARRDIPRARRRRRIARDTHRAIVEDGVGVVVEARGEGVGCARASGRRYAKAE